MKSLGEVLVGQAVPTPTAPVRADPADINACPICKGAGWVRHDVPVGNPMFGRAIRCDCLNAALETQRLEDLDRVSALGPFWEWTFENFDPKVRGIADAYEAARRFARDPYGWLVLSGGVGSGKTHLAAAVAHEALVRRIPALFTIVPDLLDHLRSTFAPSSPTQYDEMFEVVRSAFLLVLDDLGTENATSWAQEKLFQIVNYRYNYQMPTVITTNRKLDSLDERIRSRIRDQALCNVIEISAGDFRSLKPGQRRPGTPGRPIQRDRR